MGLGPGWLFQTAIDGFHCCWCLKSGNEGMWSASWLRLGIRGVSRVHCWSTLVTTNPSNSRRNRVNMTDCSLQIFSASAADSSLHPLLYGECLGQLCCASTPIFLLISITKYRERLGQPRCASTPHILPDFNKKIRDGAYNTSSPNYTEDL